MSEANNTFKFSFEAMGGPNEIQIIADSHTQAEMAFKAGEAEVRRIEEKFSRYRPDSVVSAINSSAGRGCYKADDEVAGLIDYAQACYKQSAGLFDITSGVLRKAWNFREAKLPEQGTLELLLQLVGWNKVIWRKPILELPTSGMELDFGGIGKEYAVDRAVFTIQASGFNSGLINLGGDVRVIGPHPQGTPYSIGVTHPRLPGGVLARVKLQHGALATSGDYERFFELNGTRYCHILNPRTGYPVQSFQSVTVQAESCLIAGTISTIAMLFGEKRGVRYLKELNLPHLVVNHAGQVSGTLS